MKTLTELWEATLNYLTPFRRNVNQKLEEILQSTKGTEVKVSEIPAFIAEVKAGIGEIKNGIDAVKTDTDLTKQNVDKVAAEVQKVLDGLQDLELPAETTAQIESVRALIAETKNSAQAAAGSAGTLQASVKVVDDKIPDSATPDPE